MLLPRVLKRAGLAVLLIDHVVKDKDKRGRFSLGGQHKLAGIDCAYRVEVVKPFGRGRSGLVRMTVPKDRGGHVEGFADDERRIADVHLVSDADGSVTVSFDPLEPAGEFRPTHMMESASRAVESEPGIITRDLMAATNGRNDEVKKTAIRLLIRDQYVRAEKDGRGTRHYVIRPYREDEDGKPPPPADGMAEFFEPNGKETCVACGAALAFFGGKLTCIGCVTGEKAAT
jgi:hypothetical protein